MERLALPMIRGEISKYDQTVALAIKELEGEIEVTKNKLNGLADELGRDKEEKKVG
jgi:hypothetical protein